MLFILISFWGFCGYSISNFFITNFFLASCTGFSTNEELGSLSASNSPEGTESPASPGEGTDESSAPIEAVELEIDWTNAKVFYFDINSGNDANSCSQSQPCKTLDKAIEIVEQKQGVDEQNIFELAPGNYGVLEWEAAGDFLSQTKWVSSNPADSANIELVSYTCAHDTCRGNQTFDQISFKRNASTRIGSPVFRTEMVTHIKGQACRCFVVDLMVECNRPLIL